MRLIAGAAGEDRLAHQPVNAAPQSVGHERADNRFEFLPGTFLA